MFEILGTIIHWLSQIFSILNPFLMVFATCMWLVLRNRMDKELSRMYLRCYALEKQIDFVVNNRDVDRDFFNYMTKTYKDMEDRF